MNILLNLAKYWKFILIGVLILTCSFLYFSNRSLKSEVSTLNNVLDQQKVTIQAYQNQYLSTLQALKDKEQIIVQLNDQINTMDLTIEQIIEQDEQAKSWSAQLYNPTIINKVVNTPIVLE
jgi:CII-binding regulator of phage lambda lysogenization HflD